MIIFSLIALTSLGFLCVWNLPVKLEKNYYSVKQLAMFFLKTALGSF